LSVQILHEVELMCKLSCIQFSCPIWCRQMSSLWLQSPAHVCSIVVRHLSSAEDQKTEPRMIKHFACYWAQCHVGSDSASWYFQSEEIWTFLRAQSCMLKISSFGGFCQSWFLSAASLHEQIPSGQLNSSVWQRQDPLWPTSAEIVWQRRSYAGLPSPLLPLLRVDCLLSCSVPQCQC
jgi:hypothetical protein